VLNWVRHVLFFLNAFNQSLLLLCTVAINVFEPPPFDPESQYFIPLSDKISWLCGQQPQGDDISNEGCNRLGLIMVSHMSRTLGFCQPLPLTSPKVLLDPAWLHFRWKEPRLGALPTLVLSLTLKKRCQGDQPSCLYTRSERRRWERGLDFCCSHQVPTILGRF
jgi:hypothetical protein